MTVTRSGISRAPSTRPGSTVRTIAKRREKPYKTEQSRILGKKRKLDLHTTYNSAPHGFQFVPVGTPELANLCKELSRQRGLPVNVVNAKPVSKHAVDPEKVSHHIHRIGYQFRSEIVDTACQELKYTYSHGKFIRDDELREYNDQGKLARAMAKHGLHMSEPLRQETDEQVRAAIKELFPRIPEDDLKAILKHAWAEGSHRVGTNADLELPRRVQLATIARIRHTYTDYDRLLKAFEWKDARILVEPACLAKLIEWRGENDEEDDDELEEIIRETIVIDDDDIGALRHGSEADDEDSMIEDGGYISDTSIEIIHRPMVDADLGAESNDERSRRFHRRYRPPPRIDQRRQDVRHKIGVAKEHLRNGTAIEHAQRPNVVRVHVPESTDGFVNIDGQRYRIDPHGARLSQNLSQPVTPQPRQPITSMATSTDRWVPSPDYRGLQHSMQYANGYPQHGGAVPSIEPQDDLRRLALNSATLQHTTTQVNTSRSRPITPDSDHHGKRRRVESSNFVAARPHAHVQHQPHTVPSHSRPIIPSSQAGKVIDLTLDSPPQYRSRQPSDNFQHVLPGQYSGRVPVLAEASDGRLYSTFRGQESTTTAHDYRNPPLRPQYPNPDLRYETQRREEEHRRHFVDAEVAPVQYAERIPIPQRRRRSMRSQNAASYQQARPQHQPQMIYVEPRQPSQTPQPIHGAPAPVQQLSRQPAFATTAQPAQLSADYEYTHQTSDVQALPIQDPRLLPEPQPQYYYPR